MSTRDPGAPVKGRGATTSPQNRFQGWSRQAEADGWVPDDAPPRVATRLGIDTSRSVISYNQSPDVGFDRSINPYRGCEHGCVYCFARPTHAYLDLSPGLDFESRLFYKPEAPRLLREELARPGYRCQPIAVGINTDAYQPVERELGLTRAILALLVECRHPLTVVTKSALIERDLDLLRAAAERGQASVAISVTTLDRDLSRRMEPRSAVPQRRVETIRRLSAAGIPVTVLVAPVIPFLTDNELEEILEVCHEAGARHAGYILLRLPHEVAPLFRDWLQCHYPLKAERIMGRIRDSRGGKDYDATFGRRMSGTGQYAELLRQRFRLCLRRLGFQPAVALDCSGFRPPARDARQLAMF